MRWLYPVLFWIALCNLGVTAFAVGYCLMVAPILGQQVPWIFGFAAVAYVLAVGESFINFRRYYRPLGEVISQLRSGARLPDVPLHLARRLALEQPLRLARRSMWTWIAVAAALPIYGRITQRFGPGVALHLACAAVLVAGLAGVFVYYVSEWFGRGCLLVPLFEDARPSESQVRAVSIGFKLGVLLLTTCVGPTVILTAAAYTGAFTPGPVLYVGVALLAAGILQGLFIARSVLTPVRGLARQMREARGDLSQHAPTLSNDDIGRLAEGFNEMVDGLRTAEHVRETFGRYVSPAVVEEILGGHVTLGGEVREATLLFSDIRGFTALSERLSAQEVVRLLNGYLDAMVDTIVEEGGTIDKFIGDAILAWFGVPVAQADAPLRAVRSALAMLARLERWNAERDQAGEPRFEIGIGIHTGEVVAGNIGSSKKLEYTVIGDAVNTASRIEGLNKTFGSHLLISAQTYARVAHAVRARALAPVAVKGKAQPLLLYEVLGARDPAEPEEPMPLAQRTG